MFKKSTDNTILEKEPWTEYVQSNIQAFEVSEDYGTQHKVALHNRSQGAS